MPREFVRGLLGVLAFFSMACCARKARAQDPSIAPATSLPAPTKPPSPQYLRAALEDGAVLVVGAIQYATSTSNSRDWDLGYDWPSLRAKLTGDAVRFDNNHFDTNMLTHPVAGTAYYIAARGNHLSAVESFLFAAASSTFWEYIGEFREAVSINDLIVTPVSGLAFGETLTQLGTFFGRSSPAPANELLAAILAPSTRFHDAIDGAAIAHDSDLDALGLTRTIGHRFELQLGIGAIGGGMHHGLDGRIAFQTEIINVPGYNAPGTRSGFVGDTTVSRLGGEAAVNGDGLRDLQIDALVAPFGYCAHALRRQGNELVGHRFVLGFTAGFDYGMPLTPQPCRATLIASRAFTSAA